jgi:hypothetical protein
MDNLGLASPLSYRRVPLPITSKSPPLFIELRISKESPLQTPPRIQVGKRTIQMIKLLIAFHADLNTPSLLLLKENYFLGV